MSSGDVRVIAPDELASNRAEWETLWVGIPDASPFQAPAWLLPWAEIYAPGRCRAAALWRGGRLAAVLPGFVWEGSLLLAGTGPNDHASGLFAPSAEGAAADLLAVLADNAPEPFDRIDLPQLPQDSPLASIELPGFSSNSKSGDPCLSLSLEGETGMANVPKRMRANWRYAVRRIEREGAYLEMVSSGEAAGAAADLERLHGLRWREKGKEGVLADDLAARHLRLAIPELACAGLLRIHRVLSGDGVVAVLFAMRGKQSTCYYLSGFDPGWRGFSPGTTLVGAAIAEAAREGCGEFDFLRGNEAYKLKWGAMERPRIHRVLTRD